MLKLLKIHNLILVEDATIPFEEGFNVLTGETGAGKSAMMNALGLLAGERADAQLIRKGAPKGSVEAVFDIDTSPGILALLAEQGIDHDEGAELIIRRELSENGKNRAFLNNQMVQTHLLKQVGELLMNIVGQHANQRLLASSYHRDVLDSFGNLGNKLEVFQQTWENERELSDRLEKLVGSEAERIRNLERFQVELEEIQEADLDEEEEESLFSEYSRLKHADELTEISEGVLQYLSEGGSELARSLAKMEKLSQLDPSLKDSSEGFRAAMIHLEEVRYSLERYLGAIESNPGRAEEIDERLSLYTRLKRKYGPEVSDVVNFASNLEEKIAQLTHCDNEIEELKSEIASLSQKSASLACDLTKQRLEVASQFAKEMEGHLHALKMNKALFEVAVTPKERSQWGDDHVEFLLQPNVGEKKLPLRECASGGELSRVMLALQVLIAAKEMRPTLVFDEIDANIGGETATVVGEKLSEIGKTLQVISITHFPQVAKQAHHHLQIAKMEREGRTLTFITALTPQARKKELSRMLG